MRAAHPSPLAVAGVLVLLLLAVIAPALSAPAVAPHLQAAPTPTPNGGTSGPLLPPGSSSGEPHLRTPDGRDYDFQAAGEFVLVASTADDLQVQVRQEPMGASTVVSMNTAVAANVAGDRVGLYATELPPLRVNGESTALADGTALPLARGGRVERQSTRYVIVWPDQSVVEVRMHSQYLDVIVHLASPRARQVGGLLGNADTDAANDLATRNGTVVEAAENDRERLYGEFGNSWRITQTESLFDYGPGTDTSTYTRLDFPSALVSANDVPPWMRGMAEAVCREAGVTDAGFLADCVLDFGLTGNPEFAASTAEVAAAFAPMGARLYRGELQLPELPVNPELLGFPSDPSERMVIQTFSADIRLDATSQPAPAELAAFGETATYITGGRLSYRFAVQRNGETVQVRSFTSSQAEGFLLDLPTGVVGIVVLTGTMTLDDSPVGGSATAYDGAQDLFPLARDATGQLVLCMPGSIDYEGDLRAQQAPCLANPLIVLQPVVDETASPPT